MVLFELSCFRFAVIILLVFNVGFRDTLLRLVYYDVCPILDFFRKLGCGCDLLVWIISKLVIQIVVWNSSMEYSCRFTTDTGMVACVIIEVCEWQIFMPLSSIFPTCHFEIRLECCKRQLQFLDRLRMLCRCTFECDSQDLCNIRNNHGSECSSFVCNERCWYVRMFGQCLVIISMRTFAILIADADASVSG